MHQRKLEISDNELYQDICARLLQLLNVSFVSDSQLFVYNSSVKVCQCKTSMSNASSNL